MDPSGWVAALFGALGVVVAAVVQVRSNRAVEQSKTTVAEHTLALEGVKATVASWTALVAALQAENTGLREENRQLRQGEAG